LERKIVMLTIARSKKIRENKMKRKKKKKKKKNYRQ